MPEITLVKGRESTESNPWVEPVPLYGPACGQGGLQIDESFYDCRDVSVILGYRALLNSSGLAARKIQQRCNTNSISSGSVRIMDPLEIKSSKERDLNTSLPLDNAGQGVISELAYNRIHEVGEFGEEVLRIERSRREKIEVFRLTVTEPQGQCRSAVQDECLRRRF